ncbi:hypothetical protein TBLA_0A03730 [Henningerozyma blattae CBS 6284]|uniref:26S proteasome complex subunit SEM1 n=1 Tax=Henningerozyma blattae (strain ATCC 34711 / CBS 6284 / DSM 70876 / NBRC 10599 / NRRL Y-10934 / UCD 77-7) TaxID=1071380 RepID=I2GVL9_HENB6|nr:hypothetical protein TBLA_0A03730 [Tetrapisispora blattae CBS 6284]CCH58171.1 hypothetical protein TBLA_0A03730 [Tetrapisispora blattae CBS 6284]
MSNTQEQTTTKPANEATKTSAVRRTLEEDDEFEDFPVDTWPENDTVKAALANDKTKNSNLWEEDWDDVEVEDDFTKELKAELDRHKQTQNN